MSGMGKKRLLLTSDDFGMCHSVNRGVVEAMTRGICASTNFLAPCPWFQEAVDLAKGHRLPVGVHLCLTCDWDRLTWGPLTPAPSLRTAGGIFPADHAALQAQGATDADMEAELRAQIQRVLALYGQPTHVETHMMDGRARLPIHARIHAIIARLCAEFGLAYTYERRADGRLRHFTADACSSHRDHAETFRILEGWAEPGLYHLFGHAAAASDELLGICSPGHPSRYWAEVRPQDLAFYTDPAVKARIQALGFELVGIGEALGGGRA
jgi:predicted glycoside hydrolase/deacetylase ChbG (UPF0249 family)